VRGSEDVLTVPGSRADRRVRRDQRVFANPQRVRRSDISDEEFWRFIRARVKTLRREQGWTYRDLAERSGVSTATISNFLAGHTKEPQWGTLHKIAGAFKNARPHAPAAWVGVLDDPEPLPVAATG